jgi:hypothetical protein
VGIVIALCAVLLLKWLAVVALIAWGVTVLARWLWRRHRRPLTLDDETAAAPDHGLDVLLPAPRPDAAGNPAAGPDGEDCSWCGLGGGHRDLRGRPVRPRLAHAVRAGSAPAR